MTAKYKPIVVKLITEYVVEVPEEWDQHMIEFHRNESSFCIGNDIRDLAKVLEFQGFGLALCGCWSTNVQYVRNATEQDKESLPYIGKQNESR